MRFLVGAPVNLAYDRPMGNTGIESTRAWTVKALVIAGVLSVTPMTQAAAIPLEEQGLVLADGSVMSPPRPAVWGTPLSAAQTRHANDRLADLRRELGAIALEWDPERNALRSVMVTGTPAPRAVESAAIAETIARAWLSRNLDILAPGSALDDFVLSTNEASGGIRSVGFVQHYRGLPVRGGQVSFSFKADALTFVASRALPHVALGSWVTTTVDPLEARDRARAWVHADYPHAGLVATPTGDRLVLPLWSGDRWDYRDVIRIDVRATKTLGRWSVYVDAATGDPVAREQQMMPAVTVQFDVPVRHPSGGRMDISAPMLFVAEGGNPATTDANGQVEVSTSPTDIITTVRGPLVEVHNSPAAEASGNFDVVDGDTITWSGNGAEFVDAQLNVFIHGGIVKQFVRTIAPGLGWLDTTLDATVNLEGSCNASSDGDSVYFLRANGDCQNTGRLADVVYHEVGHSVHRQSVLEGVGSFDTSLSEGISDYLAATIVDDSGMGRGFFYNDDPLRELNPVGSEWTWPDDIGTVHETGRIIGGTLWDLRDTLMDTLGDEAGRDHVDHIWYEATRRATDIPSMYAQTLLYDDDDGDLNNGTPNGCEINAVFEAHGLVDPGTLGTTEITLSQEVDGRQVTLTQMIPQLPGCPTTLSDVELRWRLRGDPEGEFTTEPMTEDADGWHALIPYQDAGVVAEYQVGLTYSNGTETAMPLNAADPWYQTFFGDVQPIYCLDDGTDLGEWTFEGMGDNWSFGPLESVSADPQAPYDDDGVLLSQDGEYVPGSNTRAISPTIDISGRDDVRLHFRRWLTVEDGTFDRATLYANSEVQWQNITTEIASVHHIDNEWRFVDIDLSEYIDDGDLRFGFELTSDQGLHFGGWTVDAMCVVEVTEAVCGDGQVAGSEQCDDGNTDDGDGCDAQCRDEDDPGSTTGDSDGGSDAGSDGAVDETGTVPPGGTGGPGDGDGGSGSGGTSGAQDGSGGDGCGCTTDGRGGPARAWLLMLGVLGLVRRRR